MRRHRGPLLKNARTAPLLISELPRGIRDETKGAAERRQNIATAEGRGFRFGRNETPAGAKDFSSATVFRP